ncbi:uncharacterized protein TNCV_2803571 [Trichonephila clavipes]|nr:uncharacterized protein TNCV_2803571 [Trichonephila clavipes]
MAALLIFCIMKIHRLGPGLNPQLWVQKASDKPTLPPNAKLTTLKLKATRGLLATDHVILNHGQVTWTTPELAPPLLTTTPHQREDVSALDRVNVHRCPARRDFSGTGLEPVTRPATIRYLDHSAIAARNRLDPSGLDRLLFFKS